MDISQLNYSSTAEYSQPYTDNLDVTNTIATASTTTMQHKPMVQQ